MGLGMRPKPKTQTQFFVGCQCMYSKHKKFNVTFRKEAENVKNIDLSDNKFEKNFHYEMIMG